MKNLIWIWFLLFSIPAWSIEPDYSEYNALLKKYVTTGSKDGITLALVNYSGFKADAGFSRVTNQFEKYDISKLSGRKEKLAFYINLYNVLAIKKVLTRYPVKSINTISATVWKDPAGNLQGKSISLDTLEHKYIRKFGDARIHFAIVCASVSCPDLQREAYTAKKLSSQLERQTKAFLKNSGKGIKQNSPGNYSVSEIFSWFKSDFGDIEKFLLKYKVISPGSKLETNLRYNWNLNGK